MSRTHRQLSTRWRAALEAIAAKHGFTLEKLQAKGRFAPQIAARRECYQYLIAEGWSLPCIGGLFNRDHATVANGLGCEYARRPLRKQIKAAGVEPLGARRVG